MSSLLAMINGGFTISHIVADFVILKSYKTISPSFDMIRTHCLWTRYCIIILVYYKHIRVHVILCNCSNMNNMMRVYCSHCTPSQSIASGCIAYFYFCHDFAIAQSLQVNQRDLCLLQYAVKEHSITDICKYNTLA